jgi:hypothetical protein
MAQVATSPQQIDDTLDLLFERWADVSRVEAAWDGTDHLAQEAFHLEWAGIVEPRLDRACTWAARGELSAGQLARLNRILDLVRRHRPFIDSILAG